MLKALLSLVVIGGLFKAARSNPACLLGMFSSVNSFENELAAKSASCSDVPGFVQKMVKDAKDCGFNFDGDKMQAILMEVCDPNSELSRNLAENGECVKDNLIRVRVEGCDFSSMLKYEGSEAETCQKLENLISDCYTERVGKPCGERAMKGVKRIVEIHMTLLEGVCGRLTFQEQYQTVIYAAAGVGGAILLIGALVRLYKRHTNKITASRLVESP